MASTEQLAFWAAIRTHPADDTPRLVYADWLDEHGDPDRAEFIRVQCALARFGPDRRRGRKQRPALEAREQALLDANRGRWLEEVRAVLRGWTGYDREDRWLAGLSFRRGFVGPLHLGLAPVCRLVAAGDCLEPLDSLVVSDCKSNYRHASVARLARWNGAGCVTELLVSGATDADVDVIVTSPTLHHLTALALWFGEVTDAGVAKLAAWPAIGGARSLDLRGNRITDAGADALVDSPHVGQPLHLDLGGNPIGPRGRRRLRRRFGDALDT